MSTDPKTYRIAIDAMGGDNAPHAMVQGMAKAVAENPAIIPIAVGDEARLKPLMAEHPAIADAAILHTDEIVAADEKPSVAMRQGRNSSMALAIGLVAEGRADAVVSAGNTGALMIMSLLALRTLEGIDRPALAAIFPTIPDRPCCVLDLGANLEASAAALVQFSLMGDAFMRIVTGNPAPRIGVLNVGEEEQKGHAELREAAEILARGDLGLDYAGFVEGDGLVGGEVDVIVTDGFSGNIALKTAEGTARFITGMVKNTFTGSLAGRIGGLFAYRHVKAMRRKLDPQRYNGAPFLGLNGVVVKSHGNATPRGFANAISVAASMVGEGYMDSLKKSVERSVRAMAAMQEAAAQEDGGE